MIITQEFRVFDFCFNFDFFRENPEGIRSLTPEQIRFVEMVIDQLTARGIVDASALREPPFSNLHAGGPDEPFAGKENGICH